MAIAARSAACRSRWTIWVLTGSACRPSAARTSASMSGPRWLYVPTGPGDLAGPDLVDGGGQPGPAAVDLERPAGELEPERGRLGVDRVGAAHHHRVGLGPGPRDEHGQQPVAVAEQPLAGGAELERQRRCRRRRCWSARGGGSGPPGPTVSATWLTKAMTSWSVVRSISAIRSTSTRGARLERRERLGRDRARARPGRGRPRARPGASPRSGPARTRSRPSRRACSGGSSGRPGDGRAAPSSADVVPALDARRTRSGRPRRRPPRRGRGEVRAPPDDRQDPAAGGPQRAVGVARRPGMEDERPGRRGASRPVDRVAASRRVRIARRPRARSRPRRPGRVGSRAPVERRAAGCAGRSPRAAASSSGPSATASRGRIDLGLRVAEAGVALEQDRAVGGQHQPGVQRATERACRAGPARRGSAGGSARRGRRPRRRAGRAAGCRRPCRRCSGRGRRRAAACGRGPPAGRAPSRPSHSAMTLASRPVEPLLDDDAAPPAPRRRRRVAPRRPPRACRRPSRPCRRPARPP